MNTILDRIVRDTRDLVAQRKALTPRSALEARASFKAPTLPLAPALRRPDLAVIAECKKASPSKGVLRPDYDPADLARQYKFGGAAAISVLTEPTYFQGAPEHLAKVRHAADLPLLRKDFLVDEYQVVEARAFGADAVLLIAAILAPRELYDLHQAATALGLACLVEVYDPVELEKLDFDQVQILGVNNRDLRSFQVDLDHSLRVFARVPHPVVKVAESGLRDAHDLAYLRQHGVDAVLIGETFMRAPAPGDALRRLRHDAALETASVG